MVDSMPAGGAQGGGMPMMGGTSSSGIFSEIMPGQGETLISSAITENYDVVMLTLVPSSRRCGGRRK